MSAISLRFYSLILRVTVAQLMRNADRPLLIGLSLCLSACTTTVVSRPDAADTPASQTVEWTAYGRDAAGTKYSPAQQITRDNVRSLVVAWTYRTGDFALADAAARDETTPIFVDGLLYASTPFGGVRALDPESGREVWAFDPEIDLSGDYGDFTNRGVSTWSDPSTPITAVCHRRIYVAPVDARLIALDARTGEPCSGFGADGVVRLDRGVLNAPAYHGEYSITSPPAVIDDMLIVGSTVADGRRADAPSGVVRAFDARTGGA